MSKNSPRQAIYAQSGGVTAVINASAAGVIEAARHARGQIGRVLAGRNGIVGVLEEDLIDTTRLADTDVARLMHTPGGAFGSCRYKLKDLTQDSVRYTRLLDVFRAHDVGYFFYNGGGDSADTCLKVAQLAQDAGYPLQAIHIPKTIDNDLPLTDTCPGFGSVAKYIAVSVREASFDVASMAATSTKVWVLEVMGRHAGWIAAAAGLAADRFHPLPLVILFPEVVFDAEAFCAAVKEKVEACGYCTVVVSEGVKDAQGNFLSDQGSVDAFGHAQLGGAAPLVAGMIKDHVGCKVHWAVSDYLQRAARHIASKTDLDQAYAVGRAAVEFALAGANAVMPTIERICDSPYQWKVGQALLERVANHERKMPREFISENGFGITASARQYLAPLIQGEAYPPYQDGLPDYATFKGTNVRKRLAAFTAFNRV